MLLGVLRMPLDMAMGDELSRLQFHGRAQEAADRIEQLEAELDRHRCIEPANATAAPAPRDETYLFEHWAKNPIRAEKLPLAKHPNGAYKDTRSYTAFYGWKAHAKQVAAIFERPVGVDPCARPDGPFDPDAAKRGSYERLRNAFCLQQPSPVPDQMALVWRVDLMRMQNDLLHKQAFFDLHTRKRKEAVAEVGHTLPGQDIVQDVIDVMRGFGFDVREKNDFEPGGPVRVHGTIDDAACLIEHLINAPASKIYTTWAELPLDHQNVSAYNSGSSNE